MKKALSAMLLLAAASYVNAQTNEPVTLPMPVEAQRPVVVQQPRFGYLDYRAVFESMPGYAEAQKSLAEIKAKYDTETAHNRGNFQAHVSRVFAGTERFSPDHYAETSERIAGGYGKRSEVSQSGGRLTK